MTAISVTFQGDNWGYVRAQMYEALGLEHPTQMSVAPVGFPEDDVNIDEDESLAEREGRELKAAAEAIQAREPAPAPRSHKKGRATLKAVEPEPVPEPEPAPVDLKIPPTFSVQPPRELPSIEALKAIVTQAVRLAQKKEGPTKILELLPDFKSKTNLGFVMEAEDKHRDALADLIEAAGLERYYET